MLARAIVKVMHCVYYPVAINQQFIKRENQAQPYWDLLNNAVK